MKLSERRRQGNFSGNFFFCFPDKIWRSVGAGEIYPKKFPFHMRKNMLLFNSLCQISRLTLPCSLLAQWQPIRHRYQGYSEIPRARATALLQFVCARHMHHHSIVEIRCTIPCGVSFFLHVEAGAFHPCFDVPCKNFPMDSFHSVVFHSVNIRLLQVPLTACVSISHCVGLA